MAHTGTDRITSWTQGLRRLLTSEFFVLGLCGVLLLGAAPWTPGLLSGGNLGNVLNNMMPLLIVALGQTLILISGGIDLSVTSIIAATSVLGGLVMNGDTGWLAGHPLAIPTAAVAMLALGTLLGSLNGLAVSKLQMPPFIVTLSFMMFLSGAAIYVTQSKNMYHLPDAFTAFGQHLGFIGPLTAGVVMGMQVLLTRTQAGRWLRLVGYNAAAAQVSGVPVHRVLIGVYAVSGFCAALASMLYTARLETASPVLGQRILLDIIGAVVIGGTSLFGGRGKVVWTLGGVLFLTLLDNILNLNGLSHFTIMIVKGTVILLAAWMDSFRNRHRLA